jgi:hypothetical protein
MTVVMFSLLLLCGVSEAKGSRSGSHASPGTGSSSSSHSVKGHFKKDGTYVAPHRATNPDGRFTNNYSTKGNVNPYTGKDGARATPQKGR